MRYEHLQRCPLPVTGSLRVTSTFSAAPSVSSVHAIALQRTIGIGIAAAADGGSICNDCQSQNIVVRYQTERW